MERIKKAIVEAINFLEQNPKMSMTQAGELFGADRHGIAKYRKNNEYKKFKFESPIFPDYIYYFTPNELEVIKHYNECLELGYPEFKKRYPAAPSRKESLIRQLEVLGIDPQVKTPNRYHYNREAFKDILTEDDAYWLGFITADGCIIQNNRLNINLAARDQEHLIKFCQYLKMPAEEIPKVIKSTFGGAYSKDNPVSCLNICSTQIVANLKDKGVTARKSGKEKPYICKTPELEKAYIRGLLDGDGYIRQTQYGMGIVGSYEICKYVQDYICRHIIDISTNHIHQHGVIYKLELSGRQQTSKILHYFYDSSTISLDRKRQLYLQFYELP